MNLHSMDKQTLSFQAEVKQLLHLVTHSLYSNKEIFLRELVSNASDACDKLRFEALNNSGLYEDAPNLEVRIAFDKDAKTLTITDNGIGLSQQEAIDHLGTIAKSFFQSQVGEMLGEVRLLPAVLFYLLYVVGIVIFFGYDDKTSSAAFLLCVRLPTPSGLSGRPSRCMQRFRFHFMSTCYCCD